MVLLNKTCWSLQLYGSLSNFEAKFCQIENGVPMSTPSVSLYELNFLLTRAKKERESELRKRIGKWI
jgi:hypothetical protein